MAVYVGLDIGGTKLLVASADKTGAIRRKVQAPTPRGLAEGLALLHTMIADVTGDARVAGIGAAIGGPLDWEQGVVSPLHQPEWRSVPLKQLIEAHYGCPFRVDVDTNAAALGEFAAGAGHVARLLYVTVSTGMGGGLILDGQIYRGAAGAHPEVAHQGIAYRCAHPERIVCDCGGGDCLEALVSGSGIRRVYGKPADALSADEWQEVAHNLGQGLRNCAALYAPERIVLGGGVALGGGDALLAGARAVLERHLRIVPVPELLLSALGYDTALQGSLVLARQAATA